jgi:hypothetical protein
MLEKSHLKAGCQLRDVPLRRRDARPSVRALQGLGAVAKGSQRHSLGQHQLRRHGFHVYSLPVQAQKSSNAWQSIPAAAPVPQDIIGTAVVIGAGISGLMTALHLAKFGMDVQVRYRIDCMHCERSHHHCMLRHMLHLPGGSARHALAARHTHARQMQCLVHWKRAHAVSTCARPWQRMVQVYDDEEIGLVDAAEATAPIILSPATVIALQAQGLNVTGACPLLAVTAQQCSCCKVLTLAAAARHGRAQQSHAHHHSATVQLEHTFAGPAFGKFVQVTSETRVVEAIAPRPEAVPLPGAQLYTTYSRLKRFVIEELERLVHGRVTYHSEHRLVVRFCVQRLRQARQVCNLVALCQMLN